MSEDEDEDIQIPITIKEDTLIKKKKTRTMSPDMLAKLALAREAAKIAKQKNSKFTQMKKDIDIQAKIDKKNDILAKHELMIRNKELKNNVIKEELKETVIKEELKETVIKEELKEEEEEEKPIIKKKKPKKKPIVIVQESSGDDDSDDDDNIIYIKKKSKKKTVKEVDTPIYTPSPPLSLHRPINPFHQFNSFQKYY
jgi:hypothetical protein